MSAPDTDSLSDSDLLRQHLRGLNRRAFEALVERHLPLVYGVAHRHLQGNVSEAEDVAQEVFLRLARQASELVSHPSLSGWCFRTARHVALGQHRVASRRRQREMVASLLPGTPDPEPDWENLRPFLDESLDSLPERDRDVILWRFFERRPHGEIAGRLGIQENAARMRVERALERMRAVLERRGITSTSAALTVALGAHAAGVLPSGLAARIASQVSIPTAVAGGFGAVLAWLAHPVRLALTVGVMGGLLSWNAYQRSRNTPAPSPNPDRIDMSRPASEASRPGASEVATSPIDASGIQASATSPATLRLEIRDPRGAPVSGVALKVVRHQARSVSEEMLTNGSDGLAIVGYATNDVSLKILTQIEGFADTRLFWDTAQRDVIPERYTLTLEPGILLGGHVVDPQGAPLEGAKIRLNNLGEAGVDRQGPRSFLPWVTTWTDSKGHWETRRVSELGLSQVQITISREGYGEMGLGFPLHSANENTQLREGRWLYQMLPTGSVHGVVVDPKGLPVPDVLISVIPIPADCSNCPSTRTSSDGRFLLQGLLPGARTIFAISDAYPVVQGELAAATSSEGVRIVLQPGRTLRVRVVNREGEGIAGAHIYIMPAEMSGPLQDGSRKTDAEGRVVWTNAPLFSLNAQVFAQDYSESMLNPLRQDEEEQIIRVSRFQYLQGTVTERDTGRAVPQFQLEIGMHQELWPMGPTRMYWAEKEPDRFTDGKFRLKLLEPVVTAEKHSLVARCSAPGFAPSVCTPFPKGEGEVEYNFVLDRLESLERWVVDSTGNPVVQATVAPLTHRSRVTLSNGLLQAHEPEDVLLKTDESGRVAIPYWPEIQRVAICAPAGFAIFSAEDLRRQRTLALEPWGRIEGHLGDHGFQTPVSFIGLGDGATLGLTPILSPADSESVPDSSGNFVFQRVPGGTHPMSLGFRTSNSWWTRFIREVSVRPGETSRVELTSPKRTVVAHVRWDTGIPEARRADAHVTLLTERPMRPLGIRIGSTAWMEWRKQTGERRSSRYLRSYKGTLEPDGTVRFTDVAAGHYQVQILVMKTANPPDYLAEGRVEVVVPEEPEEAPLDAGEVFVEPVAAP